ncbi:FHA domain-containing protein [Radiobacillus kanasensis]|uniref:DUF6382 domain-containing protein n=1 Tax=Radiobacillus kanasensis TaxID=2844358 RepID=UPI001E5C8CB0|nr:DUF6382 domain-containing protein [Radiobacillus kanasensis]UFT99201.1 FHA domain-containing protein [Radiobacillus kanasensis]
MINQIPLRAEDYEATSFLVYMVKEKEEVIHSELDVLKENSIPGLLPCVFLERDDGCYLQYDVISTATLKDYLSGSVTRDKLSEVLLNVAHTLEEAELGGLRLDQFVVDPSHIYIDEITGRMVFLYLPINGMQQGELISFKQFLKELIASIPYREKEDIDYYIELHNYLVESKDVTTSTFFNTLKDLTPEHIVEKTQHAEQSNSHFYSPGQAVSEVKSSVDNGTLTSQYSSKRVDKKKSKSLEIEEEVNYKRVTRTELDDRNSGFLRQNSLTGASINIGPSLRNNPSDDWEDDANGTTVLGTVSHQEEEGTTFLGNNNQQLSKPFLLVDSSNEKVYVTKDEFIIGRDPQQADYICANKVVGRVHAKLVMKQDEYFLQDNQSTNGSFVNGTKLKPNEKVKIRHEDKIKLANEEFEFRVF